MDCVKKKVKLKRVLYNAALFSFAAVFIISGHQLVSKKYAGYKNASELESLSEAVSSVSVKTKTKALKNIKKAGDTHAAPGEEELEDRNRRLPGYREIASRNTDLKGWITIPDTRIDYPVMQSLERPDYYLKHNFEGKRSSYGVPYIADYCDPLESCRNIVVYGHHMKDGSMFAGLMEYTDPEFYEKHPYIWFDTLEQVGKYQVIGVLNASAGETDRMFFELAEARDEAQYQDFLKEVKARSFYDAGAVSEDGRPLLTMITCEYTLEDGRLVVVAQKVLKQ